MRQRDQNKIQVPQLAQYAPEDNLVRHGNDEHDVQALDITSSCPYLKIQQGELSSPR